MKKLCLKALSAVLVLALIIGCIPSVFSAAVIQEGELDIGLISDIHYYPDSLKGGNCQAFKDFTVGKGKEYTENNSLLANALDAFANMREKPEVVLIPGDLTKDGEYEGHVELAKKLEQFEKDTDIDVILINGNHDINNSNACSFENGKKEAARKTTPEDFREIYKNLGYDLAYHFYTPEAGAKAGMLSYSVRTGAFRIIAVDGCIYSADNGSEDNEHLTEGVIGDRLLAWIKAEADEATQLGETPIVLQHHNVVPHMEIEEATFAAFVVPDWQRICDTFADAGIHYTFTGHLHAADTASYVSDNGETITDILTPTLTGYPNYFRTATLSAKSSGEVKLDMKNHDIDEFKQVVSDDGYAYPKPYRITSSFKQTFGGMEVEYFLNNLLRELIGDIFAEIREAGGLLDYLSLKGLDLEKIITDALGTEGISIGNIDILTVKGNLMTFISDLASQIDDVYINNSDETMDKVMNIINMLLSFKVSDYPCTYNAQMLGGEPTGNGCTLGEMATTVMLAYYGGDEDVIDLPYIKDALDGFDSGVLAEEFFNCLRKVVVNELVENEILSNLNFNPGLLFPEGSALRIIGRLLEDIVSLIAGENNSFYNFIDSVLNLSIVPDGYNSIDEIIDTLLVDEYLTFSQFEAWGGTIAWMVGSLLEDVNPEEKYDNNISITYTGKVPVEATRENYRLPSNVAMTLSEDSSTGASITWLTKYSITATDIELVPYSETPSFTGRPTTDGRVTTYSESVVRNYPGADLGIIGLLEYETDYVQHTVKLSGLTPGTKYSYRVGCAEKGWWSEAGVIETAGGDGAFTFFHITDPQGQRASQYERYASVIGKAKELYPDAKFVVSSGDQVDLGTHSKHWSYFLNSTDMFLRMPFMPATGNHEKSGSVITTNFCLPNVPEQELDSGAYYSYDYNSVHFTVLNTNDDEDDKLGEAQIDWLIKDINGSSAKWKVVVIHKALYSNGSHYDDKEVKGMRGQLSALLPYLGVDLVLQGHDHVYLRTDAMNNNAVVPSRTKSVEYNGLTYDLKSEPKGTVYSICGTSGVKVYNVKDTEATDKLFPRAEKLVNSEYSMFSAITVDGDRLYYNAYQLVDGEAKRVDNFAIEKTGTAPVDKLGEKAGNSVAKLLTKINLKPIWRIVNFVLSVFGKVMKIFNFNF